MKQRAIDAGLMGTIAVSAYLVAHNSLAATYRVAPALEDLMVACTGKPGWLPNPSALYVMPEWTALMERRIDRFPCELVQGLPLSEVGITWQLQEYFHLTLSTWFRIVGPVASGFLSFQSASYAVTCVMAYLIFRLGMGRLIALACTAGMVWSASHLGIVGLPIEYSKAPWVLAIVWLCGLMIRRDAAGQPIAWTAAALGLTTGVGIGFKPDVMATIPLAVATALVFVRRTPVGGLRRKAVATALVIAGLAVTGGPMLYRNFFAPTGSLLAVQMLGGQDFETEGLHASTPLYDYGLIYDDSHITWLINSYGHRVMGKTATAGFFSKQMQEMSTALLTDVWWTFPGDLALRVVAATIRVLRLNGLPWAVAAAGLFVVFAANRRAGWLAAFVTVYLCAYVSLVFQRRHFFHLEFLSWFYLGVLVESALTGAAALIGAWRAGEASRLIPATFAINRPGLLRASLAMLAIAGAATLMLTGGRAYQQGRVTDLVGHYQQRPREPRAVSVTDRGPGQVTLTVAGVSLRDRAPGVNATASDYVVLSLTCQSAGRVAVASKYLPPVVDYRNWNRHFDVVCAGPGTESTLMVPIYQYSPEFVFDGFVMAAVDAQAVRAAAVMNADTSVRLWLNLLIPADWRARSWYATLKMPPVMPI